MTVRTNLFPLRLEPEGRDGLLSYEMVKYGAEIYNGKRIPNLDVDGTRIP